MYTLHSLRKLSSNLSKDKSTSERSTRRRIINKRILIKRELFEVKSHKIQECTRQGFFAIKKSKKKSHVFPFEPNIDQKLYKSQTSYENILFDKIVVFYINSESKKHFN